MDIRDAPRKNKKSVMSENLKIQNGQRLDGRVAELLPEQGFLFPGASVLIVGRFLSHQGGSK